MANTYQMLFELNAALGGGFNAAFSQGSQQIENLRTQLDALNNAGNSGSDVLGGISAALETVGAVKALEAVYDTLQECTQAAAQFETSMAGVKRTVGGSDEFIDSLGESFKKLSTEVPITADELAGIATTAGQLGIAQENVETFTTVMAQLGTTTDLTADMAATMLAQFANITGTTDYERLGSVVAQLGDATATTASKVVEMSQGMAAAATQAGMSERDILAISAAVGSLGIEAAAGSTAMSTIISTLYKATETGNNLEEFAAVAGMTGEQFKQAWGEDAVGAMNQFIQGLNNTTRNGRSAVVILDELGIKNVRQTKAILGLASAGDLLTNTINQANQAWEQNAALSDKASVMYNTTESKITMMQNAANNMKIAIGDALTPMIGDAADGLTKLIEPLAEFVETNPEVVQGITAFVGVLGGATVAIGAFTVAAKLAAAASAIFGAAIPGVGVIMGVAAGIGALVTGVGLLKDAYDDAHPSFETLNEQFDDINARAREQQDIIDLAEEYKQLTSEIAEMESQGAGQITEKIDISEVRKSDLDLLKEIAENNGYTVNADGTVTQTLDITGVSEKDLRELDKLKTAYVEKKATLIQELELLGIDDVEKKLPQYLEFKTNTKDGMYALRQQLEIDGAKYLTDEKLNQLNRLMNTVSDKEGKLTQKLELLGFDSEEIQKLGYSSMEAFVEAVQSGKIVASADGTLTQKLIMDEIKPEKIQQIQELKDSISNETATLTQDLQILGIEDVEDKLDTYLAFKTNTADGQYALEQQLKMDGVEDITQDKLAHMKEFIKSIQTNTGKLTQTLEASGFDDSTIAALGYGSMQEFIAAVEAGEVVINKDGTITQTIDVSGDLEALKEANEQEVALAEAQNASAQASEELAEKRARLKEVTDALRNSSGGLVTATDGETEALRGQIDAYEAIAKARKDSYTAQALDVIKKQSKQYVESMEAERRANEGLAKAQGHQEIVKQFTTSGDAAAYLRNEFEALVSDVSGYEGFSWLNDDNDQAAALQSRFYSLQEIMNALSGENYDFSGNGLAGMGATIESMNIDTEKLADSWKASIDEATKYADAIEANDAIQSEYLQNLIDGVAQGTMSYDELRVALEGAFSDMKNGGQLVKETMRRVEEGVNAAKAAAEGAGDTAQTEADKAVTAVGNIISQMDALRQKYEEAREAALKSLSGRFGLFDEVGKGVDGKSTAQMEANLAAQEQYWERYNENMQAVLDKGLSAEIAQQLSDGSAESMASLAALANASTEEIANINESFAKVQASKETLASTIADMETQFSTGMEHLTQELTNTIAEMKQGSEAADAAGTTMQAYVDKLGEYVGPAQSKAQAIADAVNSALASIQTDIEINLSANTNGLTGATKNTNLGVAKRRNAIGTDYAAQGVTLVGEEGPELVYMHGGEKVLTANETVDALSGSGGGNVIELNFAPVYNVTGGDAGTIRAALEDQNQNLYDNVKSIMEEVMTDRMRTTYA